MYAKFGLMLLLLGHSCGEEWANTTTYMDSLLTCFSPVVRADADESIIPTHEIVNFVTSVGSRFEVVQVEVHNKTKINGIEGLRRKVNCTEPFWSSMNEEFTPLPPWFDGRDIFECILHLPIIHIRYEGSVKVGNGQPTEIRVSIKGKQADARIVAGTIVMRQSENIGVWLTSIFAERKISVVADGDELPEQLTARLKEFFLDFANRNKHYYPLIERVIWRGFDQCIRKKPLVQVDV